MNGSRLIAFMAGFCMERVFASALLRLNWRAESLPARFTILAIVFAALASGEAYLALHP